MSFSYEVNVICDAGCGRYVSPCGPQYELDISEAIAQAQAQGWDLGQFGHMFCPECAVTKTIKPKAEKTTKPKEVHGKIQKG